MTRYLLLVLGSVLGLTFSACAAAQPPDPTRVTESSVAAARAWPQPPKKQVYIQQVLFSPDGKLLFTLQNDNKMSLWDVAKRSEVWSGESSWAATAAFFPDGKCIALGHVDGAIVLWDALKYETRATLKLHHQCVTQLFVMADQQRLVSAGAQGPRGTEIFLWNLKNGQIEQGLTGAVSTIPICLHVDKDGDIITTVATREQTLEVVVEQFSTRKNAGLKSGTLPLGIRAVITPDGKTLILAEKAVPLQIYSLPDLKHMTSVGKDDDAIVALAVTPDGKTLLAAEFGGTVTAWSLESRKSLWKSTLPQGCASTLTVSPKGDLVAVGGSWGGKTKTYNRTLYLFSTAKGELVATLAQP
jgi:WD40 repeat protein